MTTAQTIVTRAFNKVGIPGVGEVISADHLAVGLAMLQDLVAELANQKIMIPFATWDNITLTAAKASYTIGTSGSPDKNTSRPLKISPGAFIRDSGGSDYPVRVITEQEYLAIQNKTNPGRPDRLWYNPTVPNGVIYPYPVPDAAETLYFSDTKMTTEPTALSDTMEVPRNYDLPLIYMLAIEIGIEYGRDMPTLLLNRAAASNAYLKSLNFSNQMSPSVIELAGDGSGRYNANYD